jgi:hypothetical protein
MLRLSPRVWVTAPAVPPPLVTTVRPLAVTLSSARPLFVVTLTAPPVAPKLFRLLLALPTVIAPLPALMAVAPLTVRSPLACVTLPLLPLVFTLSDAAVTLPSATPVALVKLAAPVVLAP